MPSGCVFTFGDCEVDSRSHEIRKRGVRIRVQHQPFLALTMLLTAAGDVVTRDELRRALWPYGEHVDFDRGINKAINRLRQILGDDVDRPRFIETVPKSGYRFLPSVSRILARQTPDAETREALLKARHFANKRTAVDLQRSVDHFRQAIERQPESADAWAGLAETCVLKGLFGVTSPGEAFPTARNAAERARRLDPSVAASYTALADVHKFYDWDWSAAEAAYREAIAVDPTYAVAHQWFSQLLAILGRYDEAFGEIEAARRCDPVSTPINAFISYIWLQARDYARAIDAALAALALDAAAPLTHFLLGRAYAAAGRHRPALRALKTATRLAGPLPLMKAYLGAACAQAGLRSEAEAVLEELSGAQPNGDVAFHVAIVAARLDDPARALTALEDAHRAHAPLMIGIGDPVFAELANERRYQRLIERLRLPAIKEASTQPR